MSIAKTVQWFLDSHDISYEVLHHPHSRNSSETADAAFIWEDQLAKTVLLEDELGYVMAIVPASHHLDLHKLYAQLHRKLELATEGELSDLFPDCEPGPSSANSVSAIAGDCIVQPSPAPQVSSGSVHSCSASSQSCPSWQAGSPAVQALSVHVSEPLHHTPSSQLVSTVHAP